MPVVRRDLSHRRQPDHLEAALQRLCGEGAGLLEVGAEQLGLTLDVPLRAQHGVRDRCDLAEGAGDRLPVAAVGLGHLAEEAGAERHVAVLVARDVVEALHEAGQRALLLVVLKDEVLAGESQHPLDDHVVERHRLDQALEVLRLARQMVDAALQHLVEELVELGVHVLARLGEAALKGVGLEHADLLVEAVEEAHVARLVGDLGAEKDAHLLGGRRAHHRPELLGHLLLADEEGAQAVHPLEALLLRDPLVPVDPVLREVDVLGRPLLALPQVVELRVVEEIHLAAVRRLHDRRVARGLEVVAQDPVGGCLAHEAQVTPWLAGQPAGMRTYGPGSAVASIRTGLPAPPGFPVIASPGRRPSIVVAREFSRSPAATVVSPKRRLYVAPSAERSSTRTEMNAGTRTTRGVIRPARPVNSASVLAGCSSPAPPGMSSGDSDSDSVSVSASVSVTAGSSVVSAGTDSVVAVLAGVAAVGVVDASSSSPPHAETATNRANSPAKTSFRVNFRPEMPMSPTLESDDADAMDTR